MVELRECKFNVHFETRPERFEERILTLTKHAIHVNEVLKNQSQKTVVIISFAAIHTIIGTSDTELCFVLKKAYPSKNVRVTCRINLEANDIILHITKALKIHFFSIELEQMVTLDVSDHRAKLIKEMTQDVESSFEMGPCGGFATAYEFFCVHHEVQHAEEVSWDVDTIYLAHDTHTLSLRDFDHLDSKSMLPILSALMYSSWFTGLDLSNIKLTPDMSALLIEIITTNSIIEKLLCANCGLRVDWVTKLASSTKALALTDLDLSQNSIDDRGIEKLCGPMTRCVKTLRNLQLSNVNMTAKGANRLAESLVPVSGIQPPVLSHLDLSSNSMKGEDPAQLKNLLAGHNVLGHLNLSNTELHIDPLFGALSRGCTRLLTHLDLSGNPFWPPATVPGTAVSAAFKQFFCSFLVLRHIDLSRCRLPREAVHAMMAGLAANCNDTHNDLSINISHNDLKSLQPETKTLMTEQKCITELNISHNGFEDELPSICRALSLNKTLKKLSIGGNFSRRSSIAHQIEAIIELVEHSSSLESLAVTDAKMKSESELLLNALGDNRSLKVLDVSGNSMKDAGARCIAKFVQLNRYLEELALDRNEIGLQGYTELSESLEKNSSLRFISPPVQDIASMHGKFPTDKISAVITQIYSSLRRNYSPRKVASERAYKLQQDFLRFSQSQEVIDKLLVSLHKTLTSLESTAVNPNHSEEDAEAMEKETTTARTVINEAQCCKQLLPGLQEVALANEDHGNPVEKRLESLATEISQVLDRHLDSILEQMLEKATGQCPMAVGSEEERSKMEKGCRARMKLPANLVSKLVRQNLAAELMNKVGEVNFSTATFLYEEIQERVNENLHQSYNQLSKHLHRGMLRNKDKSGKKLAKADTVDTPNSPVPVSTDRRRRPKSTFSPVGSISPTKTTELPFDLSATAEAAAAQKQNTPHPPAPAPVPAALDFEDAVAPSSTCTSQFATRQRPRRPKNHASTKVVAPVADTLSQPDDDFFKVDSPSVSVSVSESGSTDASKEKEKSPPKEAKMSSLKNITSGIGGFMRKKMSVKHKESAPAPVAPPSPVSPLPEEPSEEPKMLQMSPSQRSEGKPQPAPKPKPAAPPKPSAASPASPATKPAKFGVAMPGFGGVTPGSDPLAEMRKRREQKKREEQEKEAKRKSEDSFSSNDTLDSPDIGEPEGGISPLPSPKPRVNPSSDSRQRQEQKKRESQKSLDSLDSAQFFDAPETPGSPKSEEAGAAASPLPSPTTKESLTEKNDSKDEVDGHVSGFSRESARTSGVSEVIELSINVQEDVEVVPGSPPEVPRIPSPSPPPSPSKPPSPKQ